MNTDYIRHWVSTSNSTSISPAQKYMSTAWTGESWYHDLWEELTEEHHWRYEEKESDRYYDWGAPIKPYGSKEFITEFVGFRNTKVPKLPDSYPKGDLDRLLGFDSEGD